jgi:hypothetical protein
MKNDQQDSNQGQGRLQTENLDATGELPANNNGHETVEPRQEIAAESSGKRTVSSRKIAANRQNASKSTGPRTQTGRRMVAKNALKHGFFSKWLLIPHPDGKEDPTEYQNLYAALRVHYQPLDFLEELWVGKSQSGPGVCADFYVVRAVTSPEPWPSIITRLCSRQPQTRKNWSCRN